MTEKVGFIPAFFVFNGKIEFFMQKMDILRHNLIFVKKRGII